MNRTILAVCAALLSASVCAKPDKHHPAHQPKPAPRPVHQAKPAPQPAHHAKPAPHVVRPPVAAPVQKHHKSHHSHHSHHRHPDGARYWARPSFMPPPRRGALRAWEWIPAAWSMTVNGVYSYGDGYFFDGYNYYYNEGYYTAPPASIVVPSTPVITAPVVTTPVAPVVTTPAAPVVTTPAPVVVPQRPQIVVPINIR